MQHGLYRNRADAGRGAWCAASTLALAAAFLTMSAGLGSTAGAQSAHSSRIEASTSKHTTKTPKSKSHQSSSHPCLDGNWKVTSLTLSTTGLTFTGGVGTTVDIKSNGNALGNFTPGTPLSGSEGSAKFNGTITDHYGFSPKTTAKSGNFSSVTNVSDDATITVAGVTKPVSPSPEQGSYKCSGKALSLTFTSGASTLAYQLVPAG
jgi:hypothetical protein